MAHSKQLLVEETLSGKKLTNRESHQVIDSSIFGIQLALNKDAYYLVDQQDFTTGADIIKYLQLEEYIDNALSFQRGK